MQYLLRIKIIQLVLPLLLLSAAGSAQLREQINLPDHDDKNFHFGIYLAANRAHFNFTHHPTFMNQDSIAVIEGLNSTGINLGWLVNLRLSNHLDLKTYPLNLVFTEKVLQYRLRYPNKPEGEDTIMQKKIQGITLTLPFHIKFSSDRINNFKVFMMAGGKIDYDLAANAGDKKAENLIKIKPFDYGVEAGLGFHFYFQYFVLTPELKISYGLNNLHARDANLKYSNTIDRINSRTVTFSLTVE
ncbi:MAG: PorT family protein [Bacteroidetes bacterium]|nr:PorT family protein [Bacteroidota bacterium]